MKAKSEQDLLGKSFIQVVETLRALVTESGMLAKAAVDGKLATRGNAGTIFKAAIVRLSMVSTTRLTP